MKTSKNIKTLPNSSLEGNIYIGQTKTGEKIFIDFEDLKRHVYVIGSTGSGKTNFLKILTEELIKTSLNKCSIWILDPHGDLADSIASKFLQTVDIYYFDPIKVPVSINPLQIPKNVNKDVAIAVLTDSLLGVFSKIFHVDFNRAPYVRMLLEIGIRDLLKNKTDKPTLTSLYEFFLKMYLNKDAYDNIVKQIPAQTFISILSRLQVFYFNDFVKNYFQKTQ